MLNWTDPALEKAKADKRDSVEKVVGQDGYYTASFTPKCGYYVLYYTGPDVPWSRVVKIKSAWFHELETGDAIRKSVKEFNLPLTKYFTIKNANGDDMNAKMLVPPGFKDDGSIAYPVLMRVYGGPNSQTVSQQYGFDYMTMISNAGFVVLIVDGRGTGFKGRKYRACVSKNLGHYEVIDQIAAAEYMANLTFIDPKRIGIWGWRFFS